MDTRRIPSSAELARRAQRRRQQIDGLLRDADQRLIQLGASREAWHQVLAATARFPQLGLTNILLLTAQRPDATALAGYVAWRAVGRQVTKGEHGIRLLHHTSDATTALVHLWDITQTTGDPLPCTDRQSSLAVREALERLATEASYEVHTTDIPAPILDSLHRQITLPVDLPHHGIAELAGQLSHMLRAREDIEAAALVSHVVATRAGEIRPAPACPADPHTLTDAWRHIAMLHQHAESPTITADTAARAQAGATRTAALALRVERHQESFAYAASLERDRLVAVHLDALAFYRSRLSPSWVPAYLTGRGLAPMLAQGSRWKVGYAPDSWTALTDHLKVLGYADTTVEASGLCQRSRHGTLIDRFRNRMMIPVQDPSDGAIIAFIGRAHPTAAQDVPKYLNSPETSIYHKGDVLCGLVEGRELFAAGARPVIVEGIADAVAVTIAGEGRFAGVTPSGTALTMNQVAALDHSVGGLSKRGVLVAFDADEGGRQAALRSYELLSKTIPARNTLVVEIPDRADPAELLRTAGPAALSDKMVTADLQLVDLVIDARLQRRDLQTIEGRVDALRDAATIISALTPSDMTRQTRLLSSALDMEPSTVAREIADAVTRGNGRGSVEVTQGAVTAPGQTRTARYGQPHRVNRGR